MSVDTQGLAIQEQTVLEKMAKGNPMLRELKPRRNMFPTNDAMYLTALGAMLETRREVETLREAMFDQTTEWADDDTNGYDEVIIGGGPTAAAYCAARVLTGKPRPLVITNTLGGDAFSTAPWFRLNSSNRPGELGLSSEEMALNVIPGCPVQPSMLNMDKYQDNSVLSYVIRSALMRFADLRKGTVNSIQSVAGVRKFCVGSGDGFVYADRVIDARGLGIPIKLASNGTYRNGRMDWSKRILSMYDFAKLFYQPFPFRDMNRIAVIGGGDSGKCVVEALLGTGPNRHMSVPMLDWIEQIDWYATGLPDACEEWRENIRGRYQDIGSFLRRPDEGRVRLRVFNDKVSADEGLDKVYIGGRAYDAVVVCIGFEAEAINGFSEFTSGRDRGDMIFANDGRTVLARQCSAQQLYRIGVAANMAFDGGDPGSTQRVEQNRVALFRNIPRVVQLAMKLPVIQPALTVLSAKELRTTRKAVAVDNKGIKIRLGDKVKLFDATGIEIARGKVVKARPSRRVYLDKIAFGIKQDEGYRFTSEEVRNVTGDEVGRIVVQRPGTPERPKVADPVLGRDTYGNPLRASDRVRYVDYDGDEIYGVIEPGEGEGEFFVVRDEYDSTGNGVALNSDEMDTLERLERP